MTIFFAQYEAVPLPESDEFAQCGGAYVNCWLKAQSEEEASKMASTLIHERGWKVVSIQEECREVTEALYAGDAKGKGYYDQAAVDGECYVFHRWPVHAQDRDDVH